MFKYIGRGDVAVTSHLGFHRNFEALSHHEKKSSRILVRTIAELLGLPEGKCIFFLSKTSQVLPSFCLPYKRTFRIKICIKRLTCLSKEETTTHLCAMFCGAIIIRFQIFLDNEKVKADAHALLLLKQDKCTALNDGLLIFDQNYTISQ